STTLFRSSGLSLCGCAWGSATAILQISSTKDAAESASLSAGRSRSPAAPMAGAAPSVPETRETRPERGRRRSMTIIRTGAAALALAAAAGGAGAQCTVYRLGMPDFDQQRAAFPGDGGAYCVPTATANALAYLSNHGFPATFGGPKDWSRTDAAMYAYTTDRIKLLATLMDTDPVTGTGGGKWLWGVSIYLAAHGQHNMVLFNKH